MTQEPKELRNDGCDAKWGESKEENPGETTIGERWYENYKLEDDYWERKSEKYNEYISKQPELNKNQLDEKELDILLET